jgi:hypothetical protein
MLNFTKAFSHILMIVFAENFHISVGVIFEHKLLGLPADFIFLATYNDSVRDCDFIP